jgi:hypothetical protein
MDGRHFDRLLITALNSRRALLGGVLAALLGHAVDMEVKAKGKPKKGKGRGTKKKKKPCGTGQKVCGSGCIPLSTCCPDSDALECPCLVETCSAGGTCECIGPWIHFQGVCGPLPYNDETQQLCISKNLPNDGPVELCCSFNFLPDDNTRCGAGTLRCLADADCLNGPCLGYQCPEVWSFYDPNCLHRA